jgi:uncharacterized cupredoxin-like copper-binding protein
MSNSKAISPRMLQGMHRHGVIHFLSATIVALAFGCTASAALAHNGTQHDQHSVPSQRHAHKPTAAVSGEEYAFGRQGDPKKVVRTIAIDMTDTMRFGPADITVREGETIRFVIANKGKMMHEMVLGTMDGLKAHGELMKKHAGMEHDEPYMAHVGPGKKAEMVWHFTKAGEFHYACLVPGHFEAGMIGKIRVTKG